MSDNPKERTSLSSGVKEFFQEEHKSLTSLTLDISWPYPAPGEIFVLWFSKNNTGGKHISYISEEMRETNYVQVVSWIKSKKSCHLSFPWESLLLFHLHFVSVFLFHYFWVKSLLNSIFKDVNYVSKVCSSKAGASPFSGQKPLS